MDSIYNMLQKCKKHLNIPKVNPEDFISVVKWFKELCNLIANVITTITSCVKNENHIISKSDLKTLLLYLTQVITLLSLLIQLFLKENKVKEIITEARTFITKQLVYCLDYIEIQLKGNESITENESFQKLVDISLDKLSEIDVTNSKEACLSAYHVSQQHIEDVLCHSMSIAQVTYEEDSKIIRGGCKAVLNDLDSLYVEINKRKLNAAMCNLSIDSCYDKLCSLERKVNMAILKLSLKVFSFYLVPLDKLSECCLERSICNDALDDVIADFDLHVDRIMQIGIFAISSTSNITYMIKMKNCLASLEALESELVPSLITVFTNNLAHNRNFALVLMQHWKQQSQNLRDLIYTIIDPFTLCQALLFRNKLALLCNLGQVKICQKNVAYEEIKLHLDIITGNIKNNITSYMSTLNDIIEESIVLVSIVMVSIQDIDLDNINVVEQICKDIKNVIHELKCAIDLLIIRNKPTSIGNERIVKRCKILKGLMKKLLLSLAEDNTCSSNKKQITIKNIENDNKEIESDDVVNKSLDLITSKGKKMIKERSVLYKTPKSNKKQCYKSLTSTKIKSNKKPLPLSKWVHLRNMQFSYSSKTKNDTSLDLQITAILADLENLSTFTET